MSDPPAGVVAVSLRRTGECTPYESVSRHRTQLRMAKHASFRRRVRAQYLQQGAVVGQFLKGLLNAGLAAMAEETAS